MIAPAAAAEELGAFAEGELDPQSFGHRDHVRMAFAFLEDYSFTEAANRMANGLKRLVAKAGQPGKYNETVTVAFLAAIAERKARAPGQSWHDFQQANADLFAPRFLERWYSAAELNSALARSTFVPPASVRLPEARENESAVSSLALRTFTR